MTDTINPTLTKTLHDTALEMNADIIGFADSACFLDPEYTGNKPQDFMHDMGSVIVLGINCARRSL